MSGKLTRVELEARMADADIGDEQIAMLRQAVLDYLDSGLLRASNIGRHYAVSDPKQREDFADWFVSMMEQVTRFRHAQEMDEDEERDEDDDGDE